MISLKTLGLSFLLSSLFVTSLAHAQPTLEKLWLAEGLNIPESVLVYRNGKTNFLFVSQINGDASTVDGNGSIARLTLDGEVDEPNWVTGLNAPKGMGVFEGKLYVSDINEIVVIDIKSAQIEKRLVVPGAVFLNDIAIDAKGTLYVSDTRTNKVHRYEKGLLDDYLVKVESANGLKVIGPNLVVGAGTHLYLVDKSKNRLQIAAGFAQGIDGIESIGKGDFLVSCWAGLLYYVHLNGKMDLLIDSQKEGINTADIGFDSQTQTVFVPNFAKNSVTAYKVVTN
ncbi:GTP-binding protein [Cellvibrio zantedeschiae]|uniref:GTP-binding protein n=1 Tax=Cellvibrio zantedeschiae TaxID=1237077 RepID=UPI00167914D1|nr:GTP-binding protein [Cellvibrio zantedeschiae]